MKAGLEEVFCHVDVNNVGAQQLYKKLGYQVG
jgi:ribosomal protein S18 acetylase RimI-like enzyme